MPRNPLVPQEASRELDALIAEHVMGLQRRDLIHGEPLAYSTKIARAWEVVEKLDLFEYYKLRGCDPCWWIACDDDDSVPLIYGAATAPLAICLAALKTLEVTDAP